MQKKQIELYKKLKTIVEFNKIFSWKLYSTELTFCKQKKHIYIIFLFAMM